ncbi:hypothetical protein RYX36_004425 [Vicia faba]
MDPPPPKSVGSSRPPRPPRKNAAPPSQLSRQQPQESSPGIEESQLLSWFQEIFPGQDLPLCLQPETNNDPPRDYTLQRMQSLPRSNPVPWHKSRERLLLRELYPHLDALCTDSISKQREGLLPPRPPRPRLQAIPFPSLDSPPRSPPPQQQEIVLAPPSPPKRGSQEIHGPHSIASPSPRCWTFVVILVVIIIIALALVYVFRDYLHINL